jgi:hypothetical protein
MSNIKMQQVKLFSASVENSVCLEVGASSSDIADVFPDSSSTTGAKRHEILFLNDSRKGPVFTNRLSFSLVGE